MKNRRESENDLQLKIIVFNQIFQKPGLKDFTLNFFQLLKGVTREKTTMEQESRRKMMKMSHHRH